MEFTENFSSINLLVVFGAVIAANLIGGLWYSPVLFGKIWRAANRSGEATGEVAIGVFISSFVLHLIAASCLAAFMGPAATGQDGARLGALVGVAFVFTAMGSTNLFEKRPISLVFINSGFNTVVLAVMGFIIGQWS
jgi:uncharacterized membrane protein